MPASQAALTLYVRAECPLCDEATALLARLTGPLRFRVTSVNVDAEPALRARYGDRVPVLTLGDREIAAAPMSEAAWRAALLRALA